MQVGRAVSDGGTMVLQDILFGPSHGRGRPNLRPVAMIISASQLLAIHPRSGIASVQDYVATVRERGDRVTLPLAGHGGVAHIVSEMLNRQLGLTVTHVPYRGGGPATPDLLAGQVVLPGMLGRVSQGSALAAAIRYDLRHWEGLCRFLGDGALELDTNSVGREIRPIVVTRKTALFAGSEDGGENWAIDTTLIRTTIPRGVDPQAWFTDMLERMVRGEVRSMELASLLPWNWRQAGLVAAA